MKSKKSDKKLIRKKRRKELISKIADKISVALKEYATPKSERKIARQQHNPVLSKNSPA